MPLRKSSFIQADILPHGQEGDCLTAGGNLLPFSGNKTLKSNALPDGSARSANRPDECLVLRYNNCDKNEKIEKEIRKIKRFVAYANRQEFIFRENVDHFFKISKHPAFFTLTFADNLQFSNKADWLEASRRFHNFCRRILNKLFKWYICVIEPTENGRIHYHLLVECYKDVLGCCTLQDIKNNSQRRKQGLKEDWSMCAKYLFELWDVLKPACPAYHFGWRYQLIPIVQEGTEFIKYYLGNYMQNFLVLSRKVDSGFRGRLVRKSENLFPNNNKFSWSESGREYRKFLELISEHLNPDKIKSYYLLDYFNKYMNEQITINEVIKLIHVNWKNLRNEKYISIVKSE